MRLLICLLFALPLAAQEIAITAVESDIGGGETLGRLLREAGRQPVDVTAALARGELPLAGVKVLILGAFVTGDAALRQTLSDRRQELHDWLAAGGVIVELCQADQHEERVGWLPPGLYVTRADPDHPTIAWERADHPLALTPHRLDAALTTGWRYRGWSISWESLTAWSGFEVIASTNNGRGAAVIEAAHGRGRILITSLCPDTMVRWGEGDSPAKAKALFDNLLAYVDQLVAGRGVALTPTAPLPPPRPAPLDGVTIGVLQATETGGLIDAVRAMTTGATVSWLSPAGPAGLPLPAPRIILLDARAAEDLSPTLLAALRTACEAGSAVVELHQNLAERPLWLPAELRLARGGFPGELIVPAVAGHPLFGAPNELTALRRGGWRNGDTAPARQPFGRYAGWGVVARFGGETSPPVVLEQAVGQGRAIVVAADLGPAAARVDLTGENSAAFLANLLAYAHAAALRQVAPAPAATVPERVDMLIGRQADGTVMVPTEQLILPTGRQVEFGGRPIDLALLPDGSTLAVVDRLHLRLIDTETGELTYSVAGDGGHSVHGIAVSRDGRRLYTSSVKGHVQLWERDAEGELTRGEVYAVPGGVSAGVALSADEQTLYVAGSKGNTLVAIDLTGAAEPRSVDVGVAPFAVLRAAGKLYVSNWGGPRPGPGDRTSPSSGTPVTVDERTVPTRGSLHVIDEATLAVRGEVEVGLLPSGLAANAGGSRVYVANANSDTVTAVDTATDTVAETIAVRPDERLMFGSSSNALALSPDGSRLYVCNGTNNAVAVVELSGAARGGDGPAASRLLGFIPTGWYPGAVVVSPDGGRLYVANTKGVGSLAQAERHNSHHHQGSVSLIDTPADAELPALTARTAENNHLNAALASLLPPREDAPPRALPERHGEPSLIKHVVYIIRENRTYDQVMGDIARGNGDAELVQFGREVTPNSHKLADDFVLLDNFYCSGILSADGHQWVAEAYVTSYLEKMFGGFFRSYPYEGDDALAASPGGYLWDNVLAHGQTFRSYGEMVQGRVEALTEGRRPVFKQIYDDFMDNGRLDHYRVSSTSRIAAVQANLCPTTMGFPSNVPDVYRADQFIRELAEFEANGNFPNFVIMLLPNDHTAGTRPDMPTPRAAVADNDLALGRVVEAITRSRFWPETAIMICQDDPQAGVDHVDGHRSPAFVVSPYTPRDGRVISRNYTQVGMVKTIELLLGLPPMNQLDAAAEPMRECFTGAFDPRPWASVPNEVPLDEMNPAATALSGPARQWALASLAEDLDEIDEADEDTLNRILWHWAKGYDAPYPAHYAALGAQDELGAEDD